MYMCLHLYEFLEHENWVQLDRICLVQGVQGEGVSEFEGAQEYFGVEGNVL